MSNQVMNIKDTVIEFIVKEVCTTSNVAKVLVKIGGRQKTFSDVMISHLLSWNIANDHIVVGQSYKSTICSEDYKSNPLQMIKYTGTNENDEQVERYMFAMVKERTPLVSIDVCPVTGNEIRTYTNRYHKKSYYKRYRDYSKRGSRQTNS